MPDAVTAVDTSIIIRTLNEERSLPRLLQGISEQTYRRWEIIVVDSGSSDGTLEIARRYTNTILHIPKDQFTFGRSLNWGCREAQGCNLVFVSAHAYPMNNTWLGNLVRPFEDASVCMVYGRQRGVESSRVSEERDLEKMFGRPSKILIDEPLGHNGNAAVRRSLWFEQPFDEALTGLEDLAWARAMQQRGHRVYYAGDAAVYHVHEESLRQVYRRYFREGVARRQIFPASSLDAVEFARGLVHDLSADAFFALRRRKPLGKLCQIPATRLAAYWGTWQGLTYHKRLTQELLLKLYYPKPAASVVVHAAGRHSMQETAVPPVGPDDALIQVGYVGVCATDIEVAEGTLEYYRQGLATYPIIPGHEYAGMVLKVGDRVSGFRKGDKVVGECAIGCGACAACAAGDDYRCATRREVGVVNMNGAYARYLTVPAKYLHKLPREIPLKQAALIEPLAVALKGLRTLGIDGEGAACVVGAGPLGNLCAQLLKHRGLRVTVIDQDEERLRLLHKYDLNTQQALRGLQQFDYLIDVTGSAEVIPQFVEQSKPSAKILLLGLPYERPVSVSFSSVTCYDKAIYGSIASGHQDWEEAIRLVRRDAINLDDHTATILPLESYAAAWSGVQERKHFKVLLACSPALGAY